MSPRVVAVCGKGGTGKTTVSAVMARELFKNKDQKALMVDADHAGGLTMALGMEVSRSIDQVRNETIRQIKKRESSKKDLALTVDYLLMEAVAEKGNLAFLAIGRPEQVGCYCSVNTLLRQAIELLAGNFDITVIDAEAGIEQVNRKVMSEVDYLVLVTDASAKGVQVARTIKQVAKEVTGQDRAGLLINRVRGGQEAEEVKERAGMDCIGWAPEGETIRSYDAGSKSFLEMPDCSAASAITTALRGAGVI